MASRPQDDDDDLEALQRWLESTDDPRDFDFRGAWTAHLEAQREEQRKTIEELEAELDKRSEEHRQTIQWLIDKLAQLISELSDRLR